MIGLDAVILALAISYAVLGAVLLALLVYARLPWQLKAVAIVATSVFYVVDFLGARALLGWATPETLPRYFKLLQARVIEPHMQADDPGSVYLWVEALGDDNRPISAPRAYRLPYTPATADKAEKANVAIAAGRPQGGLTDDRGRGEVGGAADPVRPHVRGEISTETAGGDLAQGGELLGTAAHADALSFTPLLPPRMPPKTQQ